MKKYRHLANFYAGSISTLQEELKKNSIERDKVIEELATERQKKNIFRTLCEKQMNIILDQESEIKKLHESIQRLI